MNTTSTLTNLIGGTAVLRGGSPGSPLPMQCEHPGCNAVAHADYKRLESDLDGDEDPVERADWLEEPIGLCLKHGEGRERV